MDSQFRATQKTYQRDTSDLENATKYIQALERMIGLDPPVNQKVSLLDEQIPCLICEKLLSDDGWIAPGIPWVSTRVSDPQTGKTYTNMKNASRGVCCSSTGNYGSQVLDGESAFFYICDDCMITNSHKIFYRDNPGGGPWKEFPITIFADELNSTIIHVMADPKYKDRLDESPWRTMIRHFKPVAKINDQSSAP